MEKETGRIEAFSDGIFAVAITLLALEIGIKEIPEAHINNTRFWHEIVALSPKYFAYFNSFASVLLMWMSHHKIFKQLRSANTYIILANGFLLLITALVPFPAKTVGEYLRTDAITAAVLFYNGYSLLTCVAFWLLTYSILKNKNQLMPGDAALANIKGIHKGISLGTLYTVLMVGAVFISPYLGLALNFSLWIYWAVLSHKGDKHEANI